jgi:hypothetical protein
MPLAARFCRPFRPRLKFREVPGAARFALAPGYLLAAPPALRLVVLWPRLRRYVSLCCGRASGATLRCSKGSLTENTLRPGGAKDVSLC